MALTNAEKQARYRAKNKKKIAAYMKEYRSTEEFKAHKRETRSDRNAGTTLKRRAYQASRRYGISIEEVMSLYSQESCQICGTTLSWGRGPDGRCIDHCHRGGGVRGVICGSCNKMLGYARDNPQTLTNAIKYLS